MKLATWNVNSIRARQERVLAWTAAQRPDVLCLQELKVEDAKFPGDEFRALGYQIATHGQKTYNGVAILARAPLADVERGLPGGDGDEQARLIAATVDGVRVLSAYFPNGQEVGCAKYAYKLSWLERLRAHLAATLAPGALAALCGDFNVAPTDADVHDPAAWREQILCSSGERAALERVRAVGLVDVVRQLHPEGALFTWWDYRMLAFPKNRGLRLDHVYATPALAARARTAVVDREARKGEKPSDHAPVVVEFVSPGFTDPST